MFHQLYCISQLLLEYKMNKSMITVSILHENYLGYRLTVEDINCIM